MAGPVVLAVGGVGLYREQESSRIFFSDCVNEILIGDMVKIEHVGLSSQPPWPRGVSIGVGNETKAIELGQSPVHWRIRIARPDRYTVSSHVDGLVRYAYTCDDAILGHPVPCIAAGLDHGGA